jgi:hypothetical protein
MRKPRLLPRTVCIFSFALGLLSAADNATRAGTPARDTTAPAILNVAISNVTMFTATIYWWTDAASDSQVEYGETTAYGTQTALDPSMVTQHAQTITGLSAGTVYHYRVLSRDADGNISSTWRDLTFMTIAPPGKPPVISSVAIGSITAFGGMVYWQTDKPASSQADIGMTDSYGASTPVDPALVIVHALTINDLLPSTTYHLRVKSFDANGNLGVSSDLTLTTLSLPPLISSVTISGIGTHGALVSWSTNLPTDSQVVYGTTSDCTLATAPATGLDTYHTVQLDGLTRGTTYYFRAQSKTATGDIVISDPGTFETAALQSMELMIPRFAAQAANASDPDHSMHTGIAVTNLGLQAATLVLTAHDTTGTIITGDSIVNPAVRTLAPGEQLAAADLDLFGPGLSALRTIGWIDIQSSSDMVTAFSTFYDDNSSIRDGAPASTAPMTVFAFPEIDEEGTTNLYLANSYAGPANVQLVLIQSDGTLKSIAARTIAPYGALVESASSLFPDAAPVVSDSILVISDVGLTASEVLGGTTRDAAALEAVGGGSGAYSLFCPQFILGGPFRSTLSLINLGGTEGVVTLRLIGDDGVQIGTNLTVPISLTKVYITDFSSFAVPAAGIVSGYLEVVSDGPAIAGSVVIEDAALAKFKTALPLLAQPESSLVFNDIMYDSGSFTGLALLNPNDAAAIVTVYLYRSDGSLNASTTLTIPGHARISKVLTQLVPPIGSQKISSGYMRVMATAGLFGISIVGTNDAKFLSAVVPQVVR